MREPKVRGKRRPPGPPVVRVRAGAMQADVPYRIHCIDFNGPHTGIAHWPGETWRLQGGRLMIAFTHPARFNATPFPESVLSLHRLDREPTGLDAFLAAYVRCALWSSTDQSDDTGGQPLDDNHDTGDIDPGTLRRMTEDCRRFLRANRRDIGDRVQRAGADFWLDRNGHGAGAEDGHWPEDVGARLATAAHAFGNFDLYIGDDGRIHGQ